MRERKPIRQIGYDMGLRGQRVSQEFLDDEAQVYHARLNSALHTIDQRADVVRNRAGDGFRNVSLLALAIGGFTILVLALTVDYRILHDFWTTIYQNKFLQVPESLQHSVVFKSLQVLFAVIAVHFLISAPGVFGKVIRGVFMVGIGVMVLAMLVGLGYLAAQSTLPAGSTFNGKPVSSKDTQTIVSNDEILRGLGLRPSSGATVASALATPLPDTGVTGKKSRAKSSYGIASGMGGMGKFFERALNDPGSTTTVVFFATFSLIFLFVSSVGALCMHYSLKAFNALFGGVSPEHSEHAMPGGLHAVAYWALGKGEWRPRTRKDLADQRLRITHAQQLIGEPGYRERLMQRFFSDFASGYMQGLQDRDASPRKFAGPKLEDLRDEMRTELTAARADWNAAMIEERIPSVELRRTLGYNPDGRTGGSPFGYISNRVIGRRAVDGGVLEDNRDDAPARRGATAARIPAPSTDNVMPLRATRDGDVA